jgi:ribosomal protein S27AE
VDFACSCGQTAKKPWKAFISGHVNSCGKCKVVNADEWRLAKYGKLCMQNPIDIHAKSHKRVAWICDCGATVELPVVQVTSGKTSSCGKCHLVLASEAASMKFGLLRLKHPTNLSRGSHVKTTWVCDCGKETVAEIGNVVRGLTKSCGKCSVLAADHFKKEKYGKLRMKQPAAFHPGSEQETTWVCDCGNELNTRVGYVVSGQMKSCGWCNAVNAEPTPKYGKLRMKDPARFKPGSHVKITWICDCGGEIVVPVFNVTRKLTTSCGRCHERAMEWYTSNKGIIRALRPPISCDQVPSGFLRVLEPVLNTEKPFLVVCGACKNEYKPSWDNIRRGHSLTCGCCTHRISRGQSELADFIRSLGVSVVVEQRIGDLTYDISVKSKSILIEYNGLKWHQGQSGQRRDMIKYRNALAHGWKFISIFEDEWIWQRPKIESVVKHKLGLYSPMSVRPSRCSIQLVPAKEADEFYEKHHYIGRAKAPINYIVRYNDNPVACMSFSHPTRQSKYTWELVRMASCPNVRVHGIWSKLFRNFVATKEPQSVVSFSDNRLFDGGVYERLGFKLDGEIPADYYWCKGQRRWHKSGLRKTPEERESGLTEFELRTGQGYFRVWDVGKKRWVWTCPG